MEPRSTSTTACISIKLATAWLAAALLWGCATSPPPFRWVDEIPLGNEDPSIYRVSVHDVISIRVWDHAAMSTERTRVRDDGKVSLPFLKDVAVAGMTPNELSEKLQKELLSFIVDPIVTVVLEESAAMSVSVVGEVEGTGTYQMERTAGVLQAIAAAGGLTRYADRDSIYVLRRLWPTAAPVRIRFRYRDLASGGTQAAAFLLKTGDVIVVE